jgi:hypothetical protein
LDIASHVPMVMVTTGSYAAAIGGIVVMYMWFAPKLSCQLNIFFITITLAMIQLMTSISLHSKVNEHLCLYCILLLYILALI